MIWSRGWHAFRWLLYSMNTIYVWWAARSTRPLVLDVKSKALKGNELSHHIMIARPTYISLAPFFEKYKMHMMRCTSCSAFVSWYEKQEWHCLCCYLGSSWRLSLPELVRSWILILRVANCLGLWLILNALSWYDLAIPRLGTTSVPHEVRLMKSVPEGDVYFHMGRLRILFYC
jgi:hypothetical protein